MKGRVFLSHLKAPTGDKSWHRFNRNVLVLCHDLISQSSEPSGDPRTSPAAPQEPAEIIAGVMDWPVDHLVPRLWGSDVRVRGQVAALLLCESRGWELSCFSSAGGVLPGPQCSEMESMPFPVPLDAEWLWEVVSCSLAIDSMTWDFTTKAWTRAGSLRADREMCLPLVFTLTRGLCWTDVSTSPKSHLLDPGITFPQPRLSFMLCEPWVWLLSKHFTELVFYFYWYSYGLPVRGTQPIQLPLHGWHGWEFSRMCRILFTVTAGWKVKAQSKHRPLAATEMTDLYGCLCPQVQPQDKITRMSFICWKKRYPDLPRFI